MSKEEVIRFYRNEGNRCFKEKQFSEAIKYYQQGLELDDKNPFLNNNMAQAYLEQNDYLNAEKYAKTAIVSDTCSPKGYFRAAKASAGQGNLTRGIEYLQAGLRHCDDKEDLLNYLITLKIEMNDLQKSNNASVEEVSVPELVSDSDSDDSDKARSTSTSRVDSDKPRSTSTSRVAANSQNPTKTASEQRSMSVTRTSTVASSSTKAKKTKKKKGAIELEDILRDPFLSTLESIKKEKGIRSMTGEDLWNMKRKELQSLLKEGSDLLASSLSRKAVEKYKTALDMITEHSIKNFNLSEIDFIVIKYALCIGWIEMDYADIVKAVEYLKDIKENKFSKFPAVFYGLGSAYYKLNRYKVAIDCMENGLLFLSRDVKLEVLSWPGTNNIIPETKRPELEEILKDLLKACRVYHEPDAICRYSQCLSISTHIIPSEYIFYSDPDFSGFVIVICEEKCKIEYHVGCWKEYKETITSQQVGKLSDKDFIGRPCPTTDCINQSNERSLIVKIEIIGIDTTVKTSIEAPKTDPYAKETKKTKKKKEKALEDKPKVKKPPPKPKKIIPDVIQQAPRLELEMPCHVNPSLPVDLNTEDWLLTLEKYKWAREQDFGITEDDWNPEKPFFGRVFTSSPDPFLNSDCTGEKNESLKAKKEFIYSYFYEFLREEGPQKVKEINLKWETEKNQFEGVSELMEDIDGIWDLLQQFNCFALIEDYICLEEQLPEAYKLVKTELAESMSFAFVAPSKSTGVVASVSNAEAANSTQCEVEHENAIGSNDIKPSVGKTNLPSIPFEVKQDNANENCDIKPNVSKLQDTLEEDMSTSSITENQDSPESDSLKDELSEYVCEGMSTPSVTDTQYSLEGDSLKVELSEYVCENNGIEIDDPDIVKVDKDPNIGIIAEDPDTDKVGEDTDTNKVAVIVKVPEDPDTKVDDDPSIGIAAEDPDTDKVGEDPDTNKVDKVTEDSDNDKVLEDPDIKIVGDADTKVVEDAGTKVVEDPDIDKVAEDKDIDKVNSSNSVSLSEGDKSNAYFNDDVYEEHIDSGHGAKESSKEDVDAEFEEMNKLIGRCRKLSNSLNPDAGEFQLPRKIEEKETIESNPGMEVVSVINPLTETSFDGLEPDQFCGWEKKSEADGRHRKISNSLNPDAGEFKLPSKIIREESFKTSTSTTVEHIMSPSESPLPVSQPYHFSEGVSTQYSKQSQQWSTNDGRTVQQPSNFISTFQQVDVIPLPRVSPLRTVANVAPFMPIPAPSLVPLFSRQNGVIGVPPFPPPTLRPPPYACPPVLLNRIVTTRTEMHVINKRELRNISTQTVENRNYVEEIKKLQSTVIKLQEEIKKGKFEEEVKRIASELKKEEQSKMFKDLEKEIIKMKELRKSDYKMLEKLTKQEEDLKMKLTKQEEDFKQKFTKQEEDLKKRLNKQEVDFKEKLTKQEENFKKKLTKQEEDFKTKLVEHQLENTKLKKELLEKDKSEKATRDTLRDLISETGQRMKEISETQQKMKEVEEKIVLWQQIALNEKKEFAEFKLKMFKSECLDKLEAMKSKEKLATPLNSPSKSELASVIKNWETYLSTLKEYEDKFQIYYTSLREKVGNSATFMPGDLTWPEIPTGPACLLSSLNENMNKVLAERFDLEKKLVAKNDELAKLQDEEKWTHKNTEKLKGEISNILEKSTGLDYKPEELSKIKIEGIKSENPFESRDVEGATGGKGVQQYGAYSNIQNGAYSMKSGTPLYSNPAGYGPPNFPPYFQHPGYPVHRNMSIPSLPMYGPQPVPPLIMPQRGLFHQVHIPFMVPDKPGSSVHIQEVMTETKSSNDVLKSSSSRSSRSPVEQKEALSINKKEPEKKSSPALGLTPIEPKKAVSSSKANIPQKPAAPVPKAPSVPQTSGGLKPVENVLQKSAAPTSTSTSVPKSSVSHSGGPIKPVESRDSDQKPAIFLQTSKSSSSVASVATTVAKPKTGGFQKLMSELRKNFPGKTEDELTSAISEVRAKNNNSLSGLTIPRIISMVDKVLRKKPASAPGSMGLDKFGGAAWGGVPSSATNWSKPKDAIEDECIICMDQMDDEQTTLHCKHTFHTRCIRKWLRNESVCPVCRLFTRMVDEFPPLS